MRRRELSGAALAGLILGGCCQKEPTPAQPPEPPAPSLSAIPPQPLPQPARERPEIVNLRACCEALRSDSGTARSPQNVWLMAAANYCFAGVSSPQNQPQATVTGIRNALRNAPVPEACQKIGVR